MSIIYKTTINLNVNTDIATSLHHPTRSADEYNAKCLDEGREKLHPRGGGGAINGGWCAKDFIPDLAT